MANLFNSVRGLHPRKNAFNKSYRNTFTTDLGKLVPVYMQDCVPGTTIKCGASGLVRFQALLSPIMDNVNCYVHFWKIPYRLLDPDFSKWIGNEMDDEAYDPPYFIGLDLANILDNYVKSSFVGEDWQSYSDKMYSEGSLLDFLGYPTGLFKNQYIKVNIRPIQAYALLLKHWYVNENFVYDSFIDSIEALLSAQGNATSSVSAFLIELLEFTNAGVTAIKEVDFTCMFNHAWAKDYFTSALPNVQAGEPVSIGLSGEASVTIPVQNAAFRTTSPSIGVAITTRGNMAQGSNIINATAATATQTSADLEAGSADITAIGGKLSSSMIADRPLTGTTDLSDIPAITINELRVANALQVFKERLMRYGHRYVEYLRGFFNVTSSDARLQLPEWLGGGKMPINIADIEQTSATASGTPQGNLAGKGTGFSGNFAGFKTYCEEECLVIGLMYLQPKASYCEGISRFHTKLNDRYDYFNPSFEHLGEQEILRQEVSVSQYSGGPYTQVFGYTPRFAEYRFHNDETHGEFKTSLNYWTLSRIFGNRVVALNTNFIYTQPMALRRIFAVQDSPGVCLCDFYFNVKVLQPVSKYGTPMLLN